MRHMELKFVNTLIFIGLFLSTSCSSTKLTSVWKDRTYRGGILENVMVVGVSDELPLRKRFEYEFVREFKRYGVKAVSSAEVIPQDKELNRETIEAEVKKRGIGAVFVTHLAGTGERAVYPDSPIFGYRGRFDVDYPAVQDYVHGPGYHTKRKFVKLESNIYDIKTGKLIWSVKSETFDPKSATEIMKSLSKAVMENLQENDMIR